jgi:hypothetical protein
VSAVPPLRKIASLLADVVVLALLIGLFTMLLTRGQVLQWIGLL